MALHEIAFAIQAPAGYSSIPVDWSHSGVVGSGDMELLMRREELGGAVKVRIVTPVTGFDYLWQKVLEKFVGDAALGDVRIEINDNNATPYVVAMRLKQGLLEAGKAGDGR